LITQISSTRVYTYSENNDNVKFEYALSRIFSYSTIILIMYYLYGNHSISNY